MISKIFTNFNKFFKKAEPVESPTEISSEAVKASDSQTQSEESLRQKGEKILTIL